VRYDKSFINALKTQSNTSQKTQCFLVTKAERLTLFRKIIALHCENNMNQINLPCERNPDFYVNAVDTCNSYCALGDEYV
jgi:hypothetical protein